MNILNKITLVFAVLFQVSARPADLIAESYEKLYLPFYYSVPESILKSTDGVGLSYKVFEAENERAAVVFVTGWTETHLKYSELIYQLVKEGYSVYSVDNRGMGFSQRLSANPQRVHVDEFKDYVTDLKSFVDEVVRKKSHRRLFLLSHSMGGLVAAHYLARFPEDMDAAVFSSPLFQIQTGWIPERAAYALASVSRVTSGGDSYIATHGDTTYEKSSQFNKQSTTRSRARWEQKIANWRRHPSLLMSGSSNQWLCTTIEATWVLHAGLLSKSNVPALILQAGKDTYTVPRRQNEICRQMPHCQVLRFSEALHEIFLELNVVRSVALEETLRFFSRH
jgi:lysophospholipase